MNSTNHRCQQQQHEDDARRANESVVGEHDVGDRAHKGANQDNGDVACLTQFPLEARGQQEEQTHIVEQVFHPAHMQ